MKMERRPKFISILVLVILVLGGSGFLILQSQVSQEPYFQEKQLTNLQSYFPDDYSLANLQWSPSGDALAFQVNTSIWRIERDGSGLSQLVENGVLGGWSPDGRSLVYSTRSAGTDQIVLINPDDLSKETIASFTPLQGKGGLDSPSWNPKRDELAYIRGSYSQSQGWTEEIWKVDLNTMQRQLLLRDQKKKAHLRWSSDGEYLIFESSSEDSKVEEDYGPPGELWIMKANATDTKKVFGGDGREVVNFVVHPIQNSVIVLAYAPSEELYTLWHAEFPEEKVKKLLETPPLSFSLSSEGKLFSIEHRIGESGSSLWILDVSQGNRSIAVSAKQNIEYEYPVWDPAGKVIALVRKSQTAEEIFLLEK